MDIDCEVQETHIEMLAFSDSQDSDVQLDTSFRAAAAGNTSASVGVEDHDDDSASCASEDSDDRLIAAVRRAQQQQQPSLTLAQKTAERDEWVQENPRTTSVRVFKASLPDVVESINFGPPGIAFDKVKEEMDFDQLFQYQGDPKTHSYVQSFCHERRIPGLAQKFIPCPACELPVAYTEGSMQKSRLADLKGINERLPKVMCLAYDMAKAGEYACAWCPACLADMSLRDAVFHQCEETARMIEGSEGRAPVLKLGDTCPCGFRSDHVCECMCCSLVSEPAFVKAHPSTMCWAGVQQTIEFHDGAEFSSALFAKSRASGAPLTSAYMDKMRASFRGSMEKSVRRSLHLDIDVLLQL